MLMDFPSLLGLKPFHDECDIEIQEYDKSCKWQREVQRLLLKQSEEEIIQEKRTSSSRAFQQQIAREREKFIRSQQEYSETLRDVYEAYCQIEQAVTELPLSRSWITHLNLPAVAWRAKARILAEHIYVSDWLGRLEQFSIEQYENAGLAEGGGRHGAATSRLCLRSPRTRA